MTTDDTRPPDDLAARLAVFARLLEAEWYNGNVDEGAYLRLNADLTGLVSVYIRPTLDAERARYAALVAAARTFVDSVRPWDYDAPQFDSDALAALRLALDGAAMTPLLPWCRPVDKDGGEYCKCHRRDAALCRDEMAEVLLDAASRVMTLCLNHGIRPTEFVAAVKGEPR
jgi:hypothetical protein